MESKNGSRRRGHATVTTVEFDPPISWKLSIPNKTRQTPSLVRLSLLPGSEGAATWRRCEGFCLITSRFGVPSNYAKSNHLRAAPVPNVYLSVPFRRTTARNCGRGRFSLARIPKLTTAAR